MRDDNLPPHIPCPITLHQILKHPKSHILPTNHIPHHRLLLCPDLNLLRPLRLPVCQQTRPHNHKVTRLFHDRLLHIPLILVRVRQKPVIQGREKKRDIAGSVRHAGGGEGYEEGFLSGGGWREGRERGEDVVGCGGADSDLGSRWGNANAGDDDVGRAAVES